MDDEQPTAPLNKLDMKGLLQQGLASPKGTAQAGMWEPPDVEELASLFPQYEILEILGRGGMGAVYKARQTALGRLVAIKILPVNAGFGESFEERFSREARTLAQLQHPNIVTIFDYGRTTGGHLFFVMEFVDGSDLYHALRARTLDTTAAMETLRLVCDALAFAHAEGIVHRDIKPSNILLDSRGRVKVADFGLAKPAGPERADKLTLTGTTLGTLDYAAPEQRDPDVSTDQRADIYSLGVMAYEILTGKVPRGAFEPPSVVAGTDPRLDGAVMKAMASDREQRYQRVEDFARDLAAARPDAPERGVVALAHSFEEAWHDLLLFIEEGSIIPIVGAEMLLMGDGDRIVPLTQLLAERLADLLGVTKLPRGASLNQVAGAYLKSGKPAHRIYSGLHQLVSDPHLPVPEPLKNLVSIEAFRFYISSTFDRLLETALIEARGAIPWTMAYSRLDKTPTDLPDRFDHAQEYGIYHLFGQSRSTAGSFAVTDDDLLEFHCALQGDQRPANLFDLLQRQHLLLLGTGFPDWLARLFLRQARGRPFSATSPYSEVLAERRAMRDADFVHFVETYSHKTLLFPKGDPAEFIAELASRWKSRGRVTTMPSNPRTASLVADMPSDAIYLSYADEDRELAKKLHQALQEAGLPSFFERSQLEGSIHREAIVQRCIRQCALFVPIVSVNTQGGAESWCRREWKWACERAAAMEAPGEFLAPIAVDVSPATARVPALFQQATWLAPDQVVESLTQLLRAHRLRTAR